MIRSALSGSHPARRLRRTALLGCAVILIAAACAPAPGTEAPVITGQPVVGTTLHVSPGSWANEPSSFAYSWRSCTSPQVGCTFVGGNTATYPLAATDLGRFIDVQVVATNAAGSASRFAAEVGPVVQEGGGAPTDTVTIGDETIVVTGPEGSTVSVATATGTLPAPPPGETFPLGAIAVEVHGIEPGSIVQLGLQFDTPIGPVRKLLDGEWNEFLFDGLTGARVSPDRLSVDLRLQDGGRGDADGDANGTIVDPIAVASPGSLTIISNDLPIARIGEPYGFQLHAAGNQGSVTWDVVSGSFPEGVDLDPGGRLEGVPTGLGGGGFIKVRAEDGTNMVTKLLVVPAIGSIPSPTPSGVTLPDGSRIFAFGIAPSFSIGWAGSFSSDGTVEEMDTLSVASLVMLRERGFVSPDNEYTVLSTATGAEVVDVDTGEAVPMADPLPAGTMGTVFSPNGEWLAVRTPDTVQFYDTTTFGLQRVAPLTGFGNLYWSVDSTEVVGEHLSTASDVKVVSVTDPARDRLIDIGDEPCTLGDRSTTDRLAFMCSSGSVITVSAVDGGNQRILANATPCPPMDDPCAPSGGGAAPKFSPSGSHVVTTRASDAGRLLVINDDAAPVVREISGPWPHQISPVAWR